MPVWRSGSRPVECSGRASRGPVRSSGASRRGRVVYNEYHSLAGNYVVMKNAGSNTYFAYMHLTKPSKLKVGKVYDAGRTIGRVGETGDAVGCHLHFEYWVGPWQTGGRPIDPLPYLKSVR